MYIRVSACHKRKQRTQLIVQVCTMNSDRVLIIRTKRIISLYQSHIIGQLLKNLYSKELFIILFCIVFYFIFFFLVRLEES